MEKEDRQIIGNICELIPKLTPQERNNLMYLTEGMALMSRKRDEESGDERRGGTAKWHTTKLRRS